MPRSRHHAQIAPVAEWRYRGVAYYVHALRREPHGVTVGVTAVGPNARSRSTVLEGPNARAALRVGWRDQPDRLRSYLAEALIRADRSERRRRAG